MTYAPETTLNTVADATSDTTEATTAKKLNTLKSESFSRAKRISQILRRAFSESREEFQAGRTVISPLAKEVTQEAMHTVKSQSQKVSDVVNEAWEAESSAADRTDRVISVVKSLFSHAQRTLFPWLFEQAKEKSQVIDSKLSDRYGESYSTFKARFEQFRGRAMSKTEPVDTATSTADGPITVSVESETVQ